MYVRIVIQTTKERMMTKLESNINNLKLSELIKREATKDQYIDYAKKVAKWFKEQYDHYAFTLYRPDNRLSTDEDKTLYSLEVTLSPDKEIMDEWNEAAHTFLSNNMDADKLSMVIATEIENIMHDTGIKVVSHSVAYDNITTLTGLQEPIVNSKPVEARIYFTKAEDKEATIEAGLNNEQMETEVVFVEDIDFDELFSDNKD